MTDLPDDSPAGDDIEQPEHRPLITPEAFLMVQNLISLVINPKEVRRHLRSLHDALAAVDAAEKKLNDARVAHDAHVAKTTAELDARAAKLREGELALANKKEWREDDLLERERRVAELEAAWKSLKLPGEDNFPTFGGLVREGPRVSGLQKARFFEKHGRLPHVDESLNAPVASEQPAGRTVVQAGRDGTSLAQTIETPEPAGARIRGRKSAPPPGPGAA
jgi:hypothetical protein